MDKNVNNSDLVITLRDLQNQLSSCQSSDLEEKINQLSSIIEANFGITSTFYTKLVNIIRDREKLTELIADQKRSEIFELKRSEYIKIISSIISSITSQDPPIERTNYTDDEIQKMSISKLAKVLSLRTIIGIIVFFIGICISSFEIGVWYTKDFYIPREIDSLSKENKNLRDSINIYIKKSEVTPGDTNADSH